MEKKKLAFIINPKSGVQKKSNIAETINECIDKSKFDYSIEFTNKPGHATEISKLQVEAGVEIIVAVGGDGSVNEAAKGLVHTNTILGIIPAGSGNGLANFLKIPTNYKKAIDVINRMNTTKIDTGSINDKLFVSIAGIGFDGLVARKFTESRRRGFLSYLRIVTEEYPYYKPKKYKITYDGKRIKTRALFIAFANSDQFGYGTAIAPDARIDDGLLDVGIAAKPPIIDLPVLASLLYWRKIDKSKYLELFKASEIRVESKKKRWVNIDGESMKLDKKLIIRVYPNSLNIITP